MAMCRLGQIYLVLSLEASIWLGRGGGEGRGWGWHSVFLQTQFLVIKLFIRLAGNEDGHKILDEFEFI